MISRPRLTVGTLRGALLVASCVWGIAACASLAGLSDGVAPDASDAHAPRDVFTQPDATPKRDATQPDGPAPSDAARHDVSAADVHADSGHADSGHADSGHADSGHADAERTDAHLTDGASGDGPGRGGPWDATHFCKNLVVPDGATMSCDDFDEDADAAAFGQLIINGVSQLATSSAEWSSAPRSLHITTDPGTGGSMAQAYIQLYPSVTGSHHSLQTDVRVLSVASTGANQIGGFVFLTSGSPNAAVTVNLVGNADGGVVGFQVGENTYGLDGGHVYQVHPTVASDAGLAGLQGWLRVKLTVSAVDGGYADDLVVDGVTLESRHPLSNQYFTTTTELGLIGWQYVTGDGVREIYVDNVAFVNE